VRAFNAVFLREIRLALRHPADTLAAVLFFVLVCALFPFGVGPAPELLARIAPGALLAAALLAALLPLDRLFGAEAEDGSLEQLLLSGLPPSALALAKALGHWVTTGLPLLVATPVAAAMLNLPTEAWATAVIALALAIPAVIFGAAAIEAAAAGLVARPYLLLLGALLAIAAPMAPLAAGAALRAE
jgi:heme exporter protein B